MKKFRTLLLTGLALSLLVGCKGDDEGDPIPEPEPDPVQEPEPEPNPEQPDPEDNPDPEEKTGKFVNLTIKEYPKTTFYCGEEFSNNGIVLNVNFDDGTSIVTEDVTTSKPTTMKTPGEQTIKAYYTNPSLGINSYVTYKIKIIDWTKDEKMFFNATSVSSFSGTYYPKMEGMEIKQEVNEAGEVTDYWIELKNATRATVNEYLLLLDEYKVQKTMVQNGESYKVTYKFYEQSDVPDDFMQLYGREIRNPICFKYCASYPYMDELGRIHELYFSEVEDTLVVGLNRNNDMIVRYIANSLTFEVMLGEPVNERLSLNSLMIGEAYSYVKKFLFGYETDTGSHVNGVLETEAPLAVNYFLMPDITPEVIAMANYASMYPWLHGEDDLCFELQIPATRDEYNTFMAALNAKDSFVKTTRVDNYGKTEVEVNIYTIENKTYVGDLVIEVTDYMEDGLSYTISGGETTTTGIYMVYYRFQCPNLRSPAEEELFRIYDMYLGDGNYSKSDYNVFGGGAVDGMVKYNQFRETATHTTKDANEVETKEEALTKFVDTALVGYTCVEAAKELNIQNTAVTSAKYANDDFIVTVATYFAGSGKFAVEFTIEINKN